MPVYNSVPKEGYVFSAKSVDGARELAGADDLASANAFNGAKGFLGVKKDNGAGSFAGAVAPEVSLF